MAPKTPQDEAVDALEIYAADLEERALQARRFAQSIRGETAPPLALTGAVPTNNHNHVVKPGQYKNLKFGQAIFAYLEEHGEVPVSKLAADLFVGGVHTLTKQKNASERIRRTRITIGNNKQKLVFNPDTDTVKLVPPA
jgi:hypothetical protein